MDERYLSPFPGARWAIAREVGGRWIHLVEDSQLETPGDVRATLAALDIAPMPEHVNRYFPMRGALGRCPTLELLELFSRFGEKIKREVGV